MVLFAVETAAPAAWQQFLGVIVIALVVWAIVRELEVRLVLLTAALVGFAATGQPWWLLPALIFVPDLSMLGYLGGTRLGAALYNAGHTYLAPAAVAGGAAAGHRPLLLAVALVWLGHIGMDRSAGYGLKYDTSFTHTHLGHLGPDAPQGHQ